MEFVGFEPADFEVFEVSGLEGRMEALKNHLRPKLEQLGRDISARLTDLLGEPIYPHVAKHARRTVNPPNDSWVAFCPDKRGYKKHPHYQIGAWETHAFATFGVIYESPVRANYAANLRHHAADIVNLVPPSFVWIPNHMDPNALPAERVDEKALTELSRKLEGRNGELLVGIKLSKREAVKLSPGQFENQVMSCFETLLPLARMAREVYAI